MRQPHKPEFVGTAELPYEEAQGASGPGVRPDEVAPVGRPGDWSLTGLARTHRFLQPALIRAAGLSTDPVALCWAENGLPPNESPYLILLGWEAFGGIPAPDSHTILACPNEHAKILIPALARVVFGTPENITWTVLHQQLQLVDRKLLLSLTHQPPKPPTVAVEVFGLTGPEGTVHWKPPTDPWKTGFRLVQTKPLRKGRTPFSRTKPTT